MAKKKEKIEKYFTENSPGVMTDAYDFVSNIYDFVKENKLPEKIVKGYAGARQAIRGSLGAIPKALMGDKTAFYRDEPVKENVTPMEVLEDAMWLSGGGALGAKGLSKALSKTKALSRLAKWKKMRKVFHRITPEGKIMAEIKMPGFAKEAKQAAIEYEQNIGKKLMNKLIKEREKTREPIQSFIKYVDDAYEELPKKIKPFIMDKFNY